MAFLPVQLWRTAYYTYAIRLLEGMLSMIAIEEDPGHSVQSIHSSVLLDEAQYHRRPNWHTKAAIMILVLV
eukprot:SAG31_NODE_216_length_20053_cov_9.223815_16_plen_71_part_00